MDTNAAGAGVDPSAFFSRISKRNEGGSLMRPRQAQDDQTRQSMKIAEAEIEELKQSLRYIEIQLARSREENETLQNKI